MKLEQRGWDVIVFETRRFLWVMNVSVMFFYMDMSLRSDPLSFKSADFKLLGCSHRKWLFQQTCEIVASTIA